DVADWPLIVDAGEDLAIGYRKCVSGSSSMMDSFALNRRLLVGQDDKERILEKYSGGRDRSTCGNALNVLGGSRMSRTVAEELSVIIFVILGSLDVKVVGSCGDLQADAPLCRMRARDPCTEERTVVQIEVV
ncbi:hypothetical protein FOZ62_021673, partial [Perkinsus olseni]